MTDKSTEISILPPAMALARAMFRAQNADAPEADRMDYEDKKDEVLPIARRTLKILENHGYTLVKSEG